VRAGVARRGLGCGGETSAVPAGRDGCEGWLFVLPWPPSPGSPGGQAPAASPPGQAPCPGVEVVEVTFAPVSHGPSLSSRGAAPSRPRVGLTPQGKALASPGVDGAGGADPAGAAPAFPQLLAAAARASGASALRAASAWLCPQSRACPGKDQQSPC